MEPNILDDVNTDASNHQAQTENKNDNNNNTKYDSSAMNITSVSTSYGIDGNKIGYREAPRLKPKDSSQVFDDKIALARGIIVKTITIAIVILLVLQAAILAFWILLYDHLSSSMSHTFSWLVILSPFGSVYESRANLHLPVQHSPPYIPIMGMILNMIQIAMTLFYLSSKGCRRMFLFYMKQLVVLESVFTVFASIISGSLLHRNLGLLRVIMEQELSLTITTATSSANESYIWKNTQMTNKCCGVDNASDWREFRTRAKSIPVPAPPSCYDNDKTSWQNGCYDLEYETAFYYGKILMAMIASIFIMGLVLYLLSKKLYALRKEIKNLGYNGNKHRIFMRQGSNFITFGGQTGNSHVIRKNGILIDVKGALAASTAINDHCITLETTNFSFNDSICVTRESDKITITVAVVSLKSNNRASSTKNNVNNKTKTNNKNKGDKSQLEAVDLKPESESKSSLALSSSADCDRVVRGKAVITATTDEMLEGIVVTPTASGTINIIA